MEECNEQKNHTSFIPFVPLKSEEITFKTYQLKSKDCSKKAPTKLYNLFPHIFNAKRLMEAEITTKYTILSCPFITKCYMRMSCVNSFQVVVSQISLEMICKFHKFMGITKMKQFYR